jgi:hypothetical protein
MSARTRQRTSNLIPRSRSGRRADHRSSTSPSEKVGESAIPTYDAGTETCSCISHTMTASVFPVLVVSLLPFQALTVYLRPRFHQVGGGPSGLAAALTLLRSGIPVRLIDKEPSYRIGQRSNSVWVSIESISFQLNAHNDRYNSLVHSRLSTC